MPKNINYQHGKIYMIYSHQNPEFRYIGSTAQPALCQRMAQHKAAFKSRNMGIGSHVAAYEILDKYDDAIIELIETYPCNTHAELLSREGYWTREMACINKARPGIMGEMTHNEYHRKYRQDNPDKIKAINAKFNERVICGCGKQYTLKNKAQHVQRKTHMAWAIKQESPQ